MVRTYGLTHLSLAVKDLERTLAFYRKAFGARVYWREGKSAQVKTPGCHDVIAFEERKRGSVGKTGGIEHFGFRLVDPKDIDKAVKDAVAGGGKRVRAWPSVRVHRRPRRLRSRDLVRVVLLLCEEMFDRVRVVGE